MKIQVIDHNTKPTPELIEKIRNTEDNGEVNRQYKWSFSGTFLLDDRWVMDGFELTQERFQQILESAFLEELSYASDDEMKITCEVTHSPDQKLIRTEQGG